MNKYPSLKQNFSKKTTKRCGTHNAPLVWGFTLIEVLIYTVIFAIVAGLATGILLTLTRVNQQQSASVEITDQLNFIMQRIQYLVKLSSNIEIPVGVSTSTLKLRMEDPSQDPTCLSLVNGVVKLAQGPDSVNHQNCTSVTSDLTSSRIVVDTFNFQKFTQYPGHDTVSINIQVTYNSGNPQSQIQRTLQSAIARVSAATFDSDLVPGGSYNFNLGQPGSPWQKVIAADGTASNPSYTFGNDTGLGMFRAGSNILGFSTAGAVRMTILANGSVGIGTTPGPSPSGAFLDVSAPATWQVAHFFTPSMTSGQAADVMIGAAATLYKGAFIRYRAASPPYLSLFHYGDNENSGLVVVAGGNVGIGTTGPTYQLQLSTDSAAKPGTNTWTIASDARLKTDIRPFTDGLNTILGINPVLYKYNGKGGFIADGKDNIGVIAQDIQKVAPYTVSSYYDKLNPADATSTELLNFNSGDLTFTTINAIKELNNKIETQQKQIEELKAEINKLNNK